MGKGFSATKKYGSKTTNHSQLAWPFELHVKQTQRKIVCDWLIFSCSQTRRLAVSDRLILSSWFNFAFLWNVIPICSTKAEIAIKWLQSHSRQKVVSWWSKRCMLTWRLSLRSQRRLQLASESPHTCTCSTETARANYVHIILLLLDLSAAFVAVDHKILLNRLSSWCGIKIKPSGASLSPTHLSKGCCNLQTNLGIARIFQI